MTTTPPRMSTSPTRPNESGTGAVLERGLDTSNGLDSVRERLALVGKTLFLVSFGFYLFLLANLVACINQDQWVSSRGRVIDRQKGTPIAGAVIRFYGSHLPDTGIRVSTDSGGRFRVFHGVSTAAQLESLSVEAPMYPSATFRPEVKGTSLPSVEIQLAVPSAREPSRILSELTEASSEEPAQ